MIQRSVSHPDTGTRGALKPRTNVLSTPFDISHQRQHRLQDTQAEPSISLAHDPNGKTHACLTGMQDMISTKSRAVMVSQNDPE